MKINAASKLKAGVFLAILGALIGCNATHQKDQTAAAPDRSNILLVKSSNSYSLADLIENPAPTEEASIKLKIRFPEGADEKKKLPAVVFVHGSGGPLPQHEKWLSMFRDMGLVTVQSNHFESRGISSSVGDQTRVTGSMMTGDALHILNALVRHPRIDPDRIAIMGGSKGGTVAQSVAWEPVRKAVSGDNMYAAHIPLYPSCISYDDKSFTNQPMLMMIGEKDNYTGVTQCVEYANDLKQAGYGRLTVKLYPDAYHGFDGEGGYRDLGNAYSVVDCKFAIREDGTIYETTSGISMDDPASRRKAFLSCARKDTVRLGGSQAMPQAMTDVREFLTRSLSL